MCVKPSDGAEGEDLCRKNQAERRTAMAERQSWKSGNRTAQSQEAVSVAFSMSVSEPEK